MSKREYNNGELTVLWESDLCTHCESCWRGLPQVFNPEERPWVNIWGATSEQIRNHVNKCPSGALSIGGEKS